MRSAEREGERERDMWSRRAGIRSSGGRWDEDGHGEEVASEKLKEFLHESSSHF
jgi:hypothetical protein